MDFDLRDWLLILGPVFIVGVLVHGYWRMRSSRNSLKMSLDKQFLTSRRDIVEDDHDELGLLKAELPNGGARIKRDLRQSSLDLGEDVPVLMEPVEVKIPDATHAPKPFPEQLQKPDDTNVATDEAELPVVAQASNSADVIQADSKSEEQPNVLKPKANCPEKYVVLYVVADKEFQGEALLEQLKQNQMVFGDMDIYHRMGSDGYSEFSLVNAVEPGTFDPGKMHELATPAVSLFMRAHEVPDPVAAFDEMVSVAQTIALELIGEVRDESKSILTPQTIEHSREDLKDFVFKFFH